MSGEGGSIWEDGIGRRDEDARVHWEQETTHAPDPQALRYGDGRCRVVVQGTTGGPVFRHRPYVDIYWHEGLRPSYMRLTPDEARRIAAMLEMAAVHAEEGSGPTSSGA